jgi:uncharacterized iron-regulated membrane protein
MFDALEASDPLFKDPSQRKHWLNYWLPVLLLLAVLVGNAFLLVLALGGLMWWKGEWFVKRKKAKARGKA